MKDPVDRSKLVVSSDSYANIIVMDSSGRQTGFDANQGSVINGIPNAVYFEDSIADDTGGESDEGVNRSVVISTPPGEAYHIIVTGVLSGASSAWITAFSQDGIRTASHVATSNRGAGISFRHQHSVQSQCRYSLNGYSRQHLRNNFDRHRQQRKS